MMIIAGIDFHHGMPAVKQLTSLSEKPVQCRH
jgi:hypothetical protein